ALILSRDGQQAADRTTVTITEPPPPVPVVPPGGLLRTSAVVEEPPPSPAPPPAPPPPAAAAEPRLVLQVAVPERALGVGKETTGEVGVLNAGPAPVTGLRVVALAPVGVTPRRGEGPTPGRVEGARIVFQPQASLPPQTQIVYRLRLAGRSPTPCEGRLRVQLMCDQFEAPLIREEPLWVYQDGRPAGARPPP